MFLLVRIFQTETLKNSLHSRGTILGRFCTILLATILLISQAWANDLFIPVAPLSLPTAGTPSEEIIRSRAVDIDFGQLQDVQTELAGSSSFNTLLAGDASPPATGQSANPAPGTTLHLNLFDDTVVTGIIEHTAPAFSGGYSLVGRIAGDPLGTMALVINGETVSGTVRLSDGTYHLRSVDGGQYAISEEGEIPFACATGSLAEEEPEWLPRPQESPASGRPNVAVFPDMTLGEEPPPSIPVRPEAHSLIHVAIFYTPQARAEWGGTKQIKARIDLVIAESNQVYKNSGVHLTLKLATAQEVNYTEVDKETDLTRFERFEDGHMDGIHAIRDRTHADIAVLLRSGFGGLTSTVPKYESQAWLDYNAKYIFSAVVVYTRTFVHEIGHIMGLQHDRYESGCEDSGCRGAAYPYAYGYVNPRGLTPGAPESARWSTIMAYQKLCEDNGIDCPRIFRFSNPRQIYPDPGGDPLGVAATSTATGRNGPADAVRALNNTRTFVADFRSGPSVGTLENPAPDSPQSGIGLVSGWACDAGEVIVQFEFADGRVLRFPAAVGTLRSDTVGVCGHDKTGFGLLWNWNLLGDGTHTVRAFADGHLLGESEITVTTLGLGDFPRGLGGEYVVQDFPEVGKSTPLEWGQTRQNFVIAATRTVPANPGGIRNTSAGVMENPTAGSAHSGVAVVSGWHCRARSVRIELVNGNTGEVIATQAGSGTERSDTAGVCGDSDNGYGLLWNWNILGDGWHTVRAFADNEAEPFSWSTVFVTTLGEEFARGLSGEFEVEDFPSEGQSVMVEWRQEQQNFVIAGRR